VGFVGNYESFVGNFVGFAPPTGKSEFPPLYMLKEAHIVCFEV
jgi:hypothetical protein